MSQVQTDRPRPDPALYRPFRSKSELMQSIRDDLTGADLSRIQDLLLRMGATDTCLWVDSRAVAD